MPAVLGRCMAPLCQRQQQAWQVRRMLSSIGSACDRSQVLAGRRSGPLIGQRRVLPLSATSLLSGSWHAALSRSKVTHIPRPQQTTWRRQQQLESSERQVWWIATAIVAIFGGVWALIPLYKIYCQAIGQGTTQATGHKEYQAPPPPDSKAAKRLITIDFAGTVHTALPWEFVPQQRRIMIGLGETALAFYRAKNNSENPIIGVSVYHMIPPESGLYFNKIQCFCFDEQLINPGEEVDLPIFFFIDPLMGEDSRFDHIDHITLSYLFFESDSELPEEYEEYRRAVPSKMAPPSQEAPKPEEVVQTVQPAAA